MLIVFGFCLLVLAAGVVVLFAMFGELSARVAESGGPRRSTVVRPVPDARIGHSPASWPATLAGLGTLLVLSSACSSCTDIAEQLTGEPGHRDWEDLGVLISTGHRDTGEAFAAQHGLTSLPHYIDEGGDWIQSQFGVRLSPSALVFDSGQLARAYLFHDVAALRAQIIRDQWSQLQASKEPA